MFKRTLTILTYIYIYIAVAIKPTHAQVDLNDCSQEFLKFFCNFKDIGSVLNVLIPNALLFAGIILFMYIVIVGFRMISGAGSGDQESAQKARQALTSAVIGFIIVFTAYFVIQLIEFVTGVPIFNPGFNS